MMKRLISLLMLMGLLATQASAETLREQVAAPETYQNTYYSNTKRTQITVDAKVVVPDVTEVSTYAVTVRDFTAEEAWRLAGLTDPDKGWLRVSEEDLPPDELEYARYGANNAYESTSMMLALPQPYLAYISLSNDYMLGHFTRQPRERKLEYRWDDPDTKLFFYSYLSFLHQGTMGKTLEGQPLTVEEATERANDFMATMAPEYELRFVAGTEGEKGDGRVHEHLAYCFGYTRTVSGVPITCVEFSRHSTEPNDMPMAPAPGQELITLVIHEEKVVGFTWQDPYEIGEVLQEHVSLMPFEEIMNIFGTIAPLSVQHTENDTGRESKANNGMHINEIRLGYMPVLQKDNPNQWELRPVWDLMGWRILPRATYDSPCYSLMTIDAIDGTVIDRNYGY